MFGPTCCGLAFGLVASLWLGASALAAEARAVEVFTICDQLVRRGAPLQLGSAAIRVYKIGGLGRLELALSEDLPSSPNTARARALQRIDGLADAQVASLREATNGLAKAVQYGIDRYPAIVIDGAVVIYGRTDVGGALQQYQKWREAQLR